MDDNADRFIRIHGCYICPYSRMKICEKTGDGGTRTECGMSQNDDGDGFKECPTLYIWEHNVYKPIPEWCPLETVSQGTRQLTNKRK